jgi:hypothetical protein
VRHETVLDTLTGLPEVRAARTPEGQLVYRYHTIRPGGMSVWEPLDERMLGLMREEAAGAEALTERMASAAIAVAATIASAEKGEVVRKTQATALAADERELLAQARREAAEARDALQAERERAEAAERALAVREPVTAPSSTPPAKPARKPGRTGRTPART